MRGAARVKRVAQLTPTLSRRERGTYTNPASFSAARRCATPFFA